MTALSTGSENEQMNNDSIFTLVSNFDAPNGICNGTRLKVERITKHVFKATVLDGTTKGKKIFVQRCKCCPVAVSVQVNVQPFFSKTRHKRQGQTTETVCNLL